MSSLSPEALQGFPHKTLEAYTISLEGWKSIRAVRLVEINRLAQKMSAEFTIGHTAMQSPEFIEAQRGYLWKQHELNESEKFDPPEYGNHRNG